MIRSVGKSEKGLPVLFYFVMALPSAADINVLGSSIFPVHYNFVHFAKAC